MSASQDLRLHKVKHGNKQVVTDLLKSGARDDVRNKEGECPVHVYTKRKDFHCLVALLLYGKPESIDVANKDDQTALHIAVEGGDYDCVALLLAMGADVNAIDGFHQTSFDIACKNFNEKLVRLLVGVGGKQFGALQEVINNSVFENCPVLIHDHPTSTSPSPHPHHPTSTSPHPTSPFFSSHLDNSPPMGSKREPSHGAVPAPTKRPQGGHTERIDMMVERIMQEQPLDSITSDVITALQNLKSTPPKHHRILCLDGGGMKGLIQIEVLLQIEKSTGRRITELFDWIVGTSTGGIVALGLVYARLSLIELRKLYFEMCDEVFTTSGFGADSAKMDQLLKSTFKEARMSDISEPRVLVTAVNAENTDLTLVFFNNCFGDNYSEELVWKVARCTSAAPGYFEPVDKYIDGGVRANNPSNYALTKIQDSLDEQAKVYEQARRTRESPTIGCLLSVGCGVYPPEVLKDFNPSLHLFVGKRLNSPFRFKHQVEELIKLLATAVTYSEGEADNCRSRCERQGIKYYRLCPHLPEVVPTNETDKKKLCRMILEAKMLLETYEKPFKQLISSFR